VNSSLMRPKVLVISLGGTIASTPSSSSEAGVVPQLGAQELIDAVPELRDVADLDTLSFRQLPSGSITFSDLVELAGLIAGRLKEGIDAVVVTQGTDTIEETAFTLDVLLDTRAPVVVTGAMRNPTLASPDGPGNLLASVRVAAAVESQGLGCLVVMNDEVHAARFVRKMHSSSLAAFASPTMGPLGWVAEDRVRIVARVEPLSTIRVEVFDETALVAGVSCVLGDDGRTLGELANLGYRGAVLDAMGGGHVPATMADAVESLTASMPVILCSRTGSGEVLSHTYGYVGSEIDLLSRGVVSGGILDARKARVAMTLALAATTDAKHAVALFEQVRDSLAD
jgi:L-asparaginase